MSVNIEIPTERNLRLLAPDKSYESIYRPMSYIQQGVLQSAEERTRFRHAPRFAPAGQSTQMIVGATDESDRDILLLSSSLYARPTMKRVYYSGFIPGESLRQTAARAGQGAPRARKPALSGRLADALLRIPGRRDRRRATLRASIWRSTPSWPGPCGIPNFSRSMSTAPTTRCCCACRASGSSRPG